MKRIALSVLAVFLVFSGVTLAQQSEEQNKGSSMMESMPEMMKGKQSTEGGMHGMGEMGGMMGMMKMMEQCNDMMNSMQAYGERAKETKQK
jgi:uncharacterized membrane protein